MNRFRLRYGENEIDLSVNPFVIGRAADCQLLLKDGLVSRHHARVTRNGEGRLVVEDLGSRNGVLVNQKKIGGPAVLSHGDVVGIGLASLEVIDERLLDHAVHLSTLPPPSAHVPWGESDVDGPEQATVAAHIDVLTDREREVLELLVHGHTQREMADRLHISVKTIETHRARVAEKLGCRTRAELVSYAITAGVFRGK